MGFHLAMFYTFSWNKKVHTYAYVKTTYFNGEIFLQPLKLIKVIENANVFLQIEHATE